jgi:hypothetical protein
MEHGFLDKANRRLTVNGERITDSPPLEGCPQGGVVKPMNNEQ